MTSNTEWLIFSTGR